MTDILYLNGVDEWKFNANSVSVGLIYHFDERGVSKAEQPLTNLPAGNCGAGGLPIANQLHTFRAC